MYSVQEISTAVKSVAKGFRPAADSISLDVSEATEIDVLLTYALAARSLDEASAAVERVLELDSENEVANAAFTWFLGVRDSAERLELAEADTEPGEDKSEQALAATANESSEELFSSELFEGPAEKAASDTVRDDDAAGDNSGFATELPYAFQQVVDPLAASNKQDDDTSFETAAQAEQEEAEAATKAEQEEAERAEAEAAAKAEQEEAERAEAAAKAEQEEAERAEAEAAAKAEREEAERAEAAAKAEREEAERAEAAAKAEREEVELAEAEAAAQVERAQAEQEDEVMVAETVQLADEVHEAATTPRATSSNVIGPAKDGEKLTILTVDDSPTIRKLLAMTLEREGFDVVQAQDGVEALVKMSECNPAMILSDINMPRLDGYKLCKFVKKHAKTKHIPVIMLSGKDGVFDKLRGRMSGCDGYLTKPFESKDLLEKIRSFIGTTV